MGDCFSVVDIVPIPPSVLARVNHVVLFVGVGP